MEWLWLALFLLWPLAIGLAFAFVRSARSIAARCGFAGWCTVLPCVGVLLIGHAVGGGVSRGIVMVALGFWLFFALFVIAALTCRMTLLIRGIMSVRREWLSWEP